MAHGRRDDAALASSTVTDSGQAAGRGAISCEKRANGKGAMPGVASWGRMAEIWPKCCGFGPDGRGFSAIRPEVATRSNRDTALSQYDKHLHEKGPGLNAWGLLSFNGAGERT